MTLPDPLSPGAGTWEPGAPNWAPDWAPDWAPRRPPLVEASGFPKAASRFSSPGRGPSRPLAPGSCVGPFMGPSTVLATLVSVVTKLALSPGDPGRGRAEQGEAAAEEGDMGFSSRTSRRALSSRGPWEPRWGLWGGGATAGRGGEGPGAAGALATLAVLSPPLISPLTSPSLPPRNGPRGGGAPAPFPASLGCVSLVPGEGLDSLGLASLVVLLGVLLVMPPRLGVPPELGVLAVGSFCPGPDWAGPGWAGPDWTGLDWAGPGWAGPGLASAAAAGAAWLFSDPAEGADLSASTAVVVLGSALRLDAWI